MTGILQDSPLTLKMSSPGFEQKSRQLPIRQKHFIDSISRRKIDVSLHSLFDYLNRIFTYPGLSIFQINVLLSDSDEDEESRFETNTQTNHFGEEKID